MRVAVDQTTCKELLEQFLKEHAPQFVPLPASTTVTLMCDKIPDASQLARHGHDRGAVKDCSVFLDYHVTFAMSEVPTKRFTFKCSDSSSKGIWLQIAIVLLACLKCSAP